MSDEVGTSCVGRLYALGYNGVLVPNVPAGGDDVFNVMGCLIDVAVDIHSETRCFRNGETEVKGNNTRNASKADEETPGIVDGDSTRVRSCEDGILVCSNDDDADNRGNWRRGSPELKLSLHEKRTELAPSLEGEDGGHETTTSAGGGEFGGNDGTQRIVTSDAHTHLTR